jgi:hypothetical protein
MPVFVVSVRTHSYVLLPHEKHALSLPVLLETTVPILLPINLLIVPFAVRTLVPLGRVEEVYEWKARVYERGQIATLVLIGLVLKVVRVGVLHFGVAFLG